MSIHATPDGPISWKRENPAQNRVSLVIPAWNVHETIGAAIQTAASIFAQAGIDNEIIVVDDGSTDGTADMVRAEAARNERVRLVRHPCRQGCGAALRTGLQGATLDLVAYAGAGGTFDLNTLECLLPLTCHNAIVSAHQGKTQGGAGSRLLSWCYHRLATFLLGSKTHDSPSELTIIRREHLQAILPECDNAFADAEIIAKAELEGLSVAAVSFSPSPDHAPKKPASWRALPRALASLISFWWSRLLFPAAPCQTSTETGGWFWTGLVALAILSGSLLFTNMTYPLLEPDEGRYSEVVREMMTSGDWLIPTLNHKPFYDKPPLFYWLVGGCFHLFGMTEWAARLVPTGSAFLTVLATYLFGRRVLGTRPAFLAGLALALMAGFVHCGRIVILDNLLTLFVCLSFYTALEALHGQRVRWGWWAVSASCCALGVLTKGPVAFVLFAPPLIAYVWLNRHPAPLTFRHWAAYVGLVLVVVAPCYIAMIARDPHFAYHFFVDQHLVRFFLNHYHVQPWWYYIPTLLVGTLPWTLLLFPLGGFLFSRSPLLRALRPRALGFFLLWAGWCVLFFSISGSKLPPYILPAVPALAMLIGYYLDLILFSPVPAVAFRRELMAVPLTTMILLLVLCLVGGVGAWFKHLIGSAAVIIQGSLCAACIVGVVCWGRKLPLRAAWLLCGVLGAAMILETAHELVPAWATNRSMLVRSPGAMDLLLHGEAGVVCYGGEWGSVPFYVGKDDQVLNFNGGPIEDLRRFLDRNQRNLLVIRHAEDVEQLRRALPRDSEIIQIAEAGPARVLLVQPPMENGAKKSE